MKHVLGKVVTGIFALSALGTATSGLSGISEYSQMQMLMNELGSVQYDTKVSDEMAPTFVYPNEEEIDDEDDVVESGYIYGISKMDPSVGFTQEGDDDWEDYNDEYMYDYDDYTNHYVIHPESNTIINNVDNSVNTVTNNINNDVYIDNSTTNNYGYEYDYEEPEDEEFEEVETEIVETDYESYNMEVEYEEPVETTDEDDNFIEVSIDELIDDLSW